VLTRGGNTARLVAKYRPIVPVLTVAVPVLTTDALTWACSNEAPARQCLVTRGLLPLLAEGSARATDSGAFSFLFVFCCFFVRVVVCLASLSTAARPKLAGRRTRRRTRARSHQISPSSHHHKPQTKKPAPQTKKKKQKNEKQTRPTRSSRPPCAWPPSGATSRAGTAWWRCTAWAPPRWSRSSTCERKKRKEERRKKRKGQKDVLFFPLFCTPLRTQIFC
jgi:hypothetical protein